MFVLQRSRTLSQPKHRRLPGISSFLAWADNQNFNKLSWLAVALVVHGCLLTPVTVMVVMTTSQEFSLVMASLGAMALSLVTNLAALPTRITIPAFFLSILADVVIILASIYSIL